MSDGITANKDPFSKKPSESFVATGLIEKILDGAVSSFPALGSPINSCFISIKYSVQEAKRRRMGYFLGCMSIFFVVFLVAVLSSVLQYGPLAFLLILEADEGELDMNVYAGWWSGMKYVNLSAAEEILPEQRDRMTARFNSILCDAWVVKDCPLLQSQSDLLFNDSRILYEGIGDNKNVCLERGGKECMKRLCGNKLPTALRVSAIDSVREQKADIGRAYLHPPIPSDSLYLHENIARYLEVSEGDVIIVAITNFMVDGILIQAKDYISKNLGFNNWPSDDFYMLVPFRIAVVLSTADSVAKIGSSYKNVALVEFGTLLQTVSAHLNPRYPPQYRDFIRERANRNELYQYASDIYLSCGVPRTDCFKSSDYAVVTTDLLKWQTDVVVRLGFNKLVANTPIIRRLKDSGYVSAFLNLLLSLVLVFLGGISMFLVYSLLMVAVETRTFEFGIFRMVGMSRKGLVAVVLTQALFFAIPAWLVGIVFAQATISILSTILYQFTRVNVTPVLPASAFSLATLFGIMCPVISSIYPIRMALSKNLRDSLDTRRAKTKAVEVKIERNDSDSTFRASLVGMGCLFLCFGILLYYFFPKSIIDDNFTLLFNIFLVVLVGLMLGLVILCFNLQPILEYVLGMMLLRGLFYKLENSSMFTIVQKNLTIHRARNRKTALTYAVNEHCMEMALAIILFLNVSIKIQLTSLIYSTKQRQGSDIVFNMRNYPRSLPNEKSIVEFLDSNDLVESYAFVSYPLTRVLNRCAIQNYGRLVNEETAVFAVTPNFFSVVDSNNFLLGDQPKALVQLGQDKEIYDNLGQALYSAGGGMFISDNKMKSLGRTIATSSSQDDLKMRYPFLIYSEGYDPWKEETTYQYTPRYPLAFLRQSPVFLAMRSNPGSFSDAIASIPDIVEMSNEVFTSVTQYPLERLFIKTKPKIRQSEINGLMSQINQISNNEAYYASSESSIQGFKSASDLLTLVFQGVTLLTMIVAFFSLNSSMYSNILEQKQEMGVWRSLGFQRNTIYRIFAYEAFILVASSSILGMMIGTALGTTMSAQRAILTQTPIYFEFPTLLVVQVIAISFLCSIFSTVGPVSQYLRKPIINLLK